MNLESVMEEIAGRLSAIEGLRVFPYPTDAVQPPAAVVSFPETYTFDETYQRGVDRMTLPVVVVVGKPYDRPTRTLLAGYVNGSGPESVKAAVESGDGAAFDVARVTGVEFDVVTIAGTDYMAALFDLDIAGQGA